MRTRSGTRVGFVPVHHPSGDEGAKFKTSSPYPSETCDIGGSAIHEDFLDDDELRFTGPDFDEERPEEASSARLTASSRTSMANGLRR